MPEENRGKTILEGPCANIGTVEAPGDRSLEYGGGENMTKTRRDFLAEASLGLVGAAVAGMQQQKPGEPPAGTPPAFGTGPAVGPEVSAGTFLEAEKVVQAEMTPEDRKSTRLNSSH